MAVAVPKMRGRSRIRRFEVFTAVIMKNGVFCDVTPCGSSKNHMV
jgi:hypothetical protein